MRRWTLATAVVAVVGLATAASAVSDGEKDAQGEIKVIMAVDAGAAAQGAAGDQHTVQRMRFVSSEPGEDGQPQERVIIRTIGSGQVISGDDEVDENAGWLGVQIGVKQRAGDDEATISGVKVIGVIDDSPAAEAGLQEGDLILEINDRSVGDDVMKLVREISDAGAGARVKFTVMRDGSRHTIVATLGSRADMPTTALLPGPDATWHDSVKTRSHLLFKGDNGKWIMGDPDDADADVHVFLKQLEDQLPGQMGRTVNVFVNDGTVKIEATQTKDGETLSVTREGEGEIVVTRRSEGSDEETTARYANEDELAAADEEAFDLYQAATGNLVIATDVDGDLPFFNVTADIDLGNLDEVMKEWQATLEQLPDVPDVPDVPDIQALLNDITGEGRAFHWRTARISRSIRENADGSIDVTTRKGSNELIQHYTDADDLAARSPSDYEAYVDLKNAEEDQ